MANSVTQKHAKFVDQLYARTIEKRIDWEIDPFSNDLQTTIGAFSVKLSEGTNGEGTPVEIVQIKNDDRMIVDSFNDDDLQSISAVEFGSYWKKMQALRIAAYRQAVGAEAALDSIMSQLEGDDDEW